MSSIRDEHERHGSAALIPRSTLVSSATKGGSDAIDFPVECAAKTQLDIRHREEVGGDDLGVNLPRRSPSENRRNGNR
jgi:hypothetical protein